jgi:hypothetical protein
MDFIPTNLLCLAKAIHKLEQKGLAQSESLNVVSEVWNALNAKKGDAKKKCTQCHLKMLAPTNN